MSGKYEGYLQALLAPLGLYDLTGGRQQGGQRQRKETVHGGSLQIQMFL